MPNKLAALALLALLNAPLTATAIPVTYQIKFTVLSGLIVTHTYPEQPGPTTVDVEDAAGKVYLGLFAVDDEILLTDGINKPGDLDFFFIQMEDNIWGYNIPANNSFAGFRGPLPGAPFCMFCLGASSPGFDVVDGTITNLRGGVHGSSDIPFVDFSLSGANTFNALGSPFFEPGTSSSFVVRSVESSGSIFGTMELFRVPEPGSLSLFAVGLLVLTLSIRRARA